MYTTNFYSWLVQLTQNLKMHSCYYWPWHPYPDGFGLSLEFFYMLSLLNFGEKMNLHAIAATESKQSVDM